MLHIFAQLFFAIMNIQDEGEHTTIVAQPSQLMSAPMILGDVKKYTPILYRGTALVADKTNRLRLELLTAATTAYSFDPQMKIEEVCHCAVLKNFNSCTVFYVFVEAVVSTRILITRLH